MAKPDSTEQSREQTDHALEKVDSCLSASQGITGEQTFNLGGLDEVRQPPTSCAGYGGGDSRYIEPPNNPSLGHWERRMSGDSDAESRYGQDIRESDSSSTVEQQRGDSTAYGTLNSVTRPSEAGLSSRGDGGYVDEEDYSLGSSVGDASSKQSGTHSKWGTSDDASGSEVRNGVRHGVTPHGVASGAGVADGLGGSTPTSSVIKEHQYHLTEVTPQQQETAYSHALTDPDGPSEASRDRFLEEAGITGNTMGGTAVDQRKEVAHGANHSDGEGFVKRVLRKLAGHGNMDDSIDRHSDVKPVSSDSKPEEDEDYEQPGCITQLKDKLLPNRNRYHDEINPEIYE